MTVKILTALVLLGTLLVTTACTVTTDVVTTCDEFAKSNQITKSADIQNSTTFDVSLCSNPSTGYSWTETAQISDSTVIQQVSHTFVQPTSTAIGAPGTEEWTFKAIKKGSATISMRYRRPWEPDQPSDWVFTLTVSVK